MRQLMAIMFTDIVGYTAMMQADESKALKLRARHRAVFRGMHALHGGHIVQYFGDGTLSVFNSAVAAAQCAIDIQRRMQQSTPVPLRIGIHMGDIVFNKTEVYGDGVNVASRIESLATSSSILISGKVNDELKNHGSISTKSIGQFQLKNVSGATEIFAISNKGIRIPESFEVNHATKLQSNTIAVLPFSNMSSCDAWFSNGVAEEITNGLSKLQAIKVSAKQESLKRIEKNREINYVIKGSVRHSNDVVRISVHLVNVKSDNYEWSETWDYPTGNRFHIQDQVRERVVEKMIQHFSLSSKTTLETPSSQIRPMINGKLIALAS